MTADRVELIADDDPLIVLDRCVALVTPELAMHSFTVEARGRDWAHWTPGFGNVIRASFREEGK